MAGQDDRSRGVERFLKKSPIDRRRVFDGHNFLVFLGLSLFQFVKRDKKRDGERKRAVYVILASRAEKSTGGVAFTGSLAVFGVLDVRRKTRQKKNVGDLREESRRRFVAKSLTR